MRISRTILGAALLAAFVVGASGAAQAETFNFRMASGHAPAILYVNLMQNFFAPEVKKRVEAKTPHKINFVEGYAGSIVKVNETMGGVQNGVVDFGGFCFCFEPANLPLHSFQVYLPFGPQGAVQSGKQARAVYNQVPVMPGVFEEKFGQKLIALMPFDSYHLGTNFEWKTVADLKGHKIAGAGPNLPWLEFAGAVPVQSSMAEAYASLQTRVYDGWIIFASVYLSGRLHEQAPYFTMIGFGAITWHGLTVNSRTWARLPKEVQEIVLEVAAEYEGKSGTINDEKFDENIKTLAAQNTKIVTLPADVRRAWAEPIKEWPKQKAKEIDAKGLPATQLFKIAMSEAEKLGYEWPIRYKVD